MRNTRIIHQVTLKHMKMNAKRTVISIIGLMLMVMLLTSVIVGKDTAVGYFVELGAAQSGTYHYEVNDIDREKLAQIKQLKGVTEIGVTEDLKYTEFAKTGNPERPFLNIRCYSAEAMEWTRIKTVEGRLPENGDEIVISYDAVKDGSGIKVGDTIDAATFKRFMTNNQESGSTVIPFPYVVIPSGKKVEIPYDMYYFVPGTEFGDKFYQTHDEVHEDTGFKHTYTVVGLIECPKFEKSDYAWYSAITKTDESSLSNSVFNALIMTNPGRTDSNFGSKMREIVGDMNLHSNDMVLIFSGSSKDNSLNFIVNAALIFFIALIVFISVILIYNVFALSYDERVKYLGMLSSVGATGKQKRSSVYYEAAMMLIPAVPAGFLAGLGVVKGAACVAGPFAKKLITMNPIVSSDVAPSLKINPAAVVAVVVLSIVTVFVSALIPARRISKVGSIESIRGTKGKSEAKKSRAASDRYIKGSFSRLLSKKFIKNDKSKSLGIIRAVTVFLMVTVIVFFAAGLIMKMVEYKLKDNSIRDVYYNDRAYVLTMFNGDRKLFTPEELAENIRNMDGVSDVVTVKRSQIAMNVDFGAISDEYWDKFYDIASMFYSEGQYSREEFDARFKKDEDSRPTIGVYAFDDEVFAKIAKETGAVAYGSDEHPCILISNAAIATDRYGIDRRKARDYRYMAIDDAFTVSDGENIPLYPMAMPRDKALELGYDVNSLDFPEIDTNGRPVDFKVIKKVNIKELGKYFSGSGNFNLNMIVPMSVAGYIEKLNVDKLETTVYFNCDNMSTVSSLLEYTEQIQNEGAFINLGSNIVSNSSIKDIIASLIRIVLIVFTVIASSICLLNVYSSISGLMVSRRKHFCILKSIGSTSGQLVRAELSESIKMLIRSFATAVPVIGIICFGLSKCLISRFGYFTFDFPWVYSLGIVAFISAAVILMTIICVRRENKTDIIGGIKRESV